VITAVPLAMDVTAPVEETVATAVFEDVHAEVDVTSCDVPLASMAVAVNCVVKPTAGAVPATTTVETAVAEVGDPQATTDIQVAKTRRRAANDRMVIRLLARRHWHPQRLQELRPEVCGRSVAKM